MRTPPSQSWGILFPAECLVDTSGKPSLWKTICHGTLWYTMVHCGKNGLWNYEPVLLVRTKDQAQAVGATSGLLCVPPQQEWGFQGKYSLWFSLFLSKNPQAELPILEGLEGGGHDEVLSAGQRDAAGDLAQVHIGGSPGCWLVLHKESTACMHIWAVFQLWRTWFS